MRANLNRALFGSDTPSKFVRPRLGEELVKVRTWPTVLAGAPLAKLVALGKEVETLIKSCDAAVQKHSDATANLQAFLVNDWAPFVAKVNGERQLLGGEAKKQLRLDGSEGGDVSFYRYYGGANYFYEPLTVQIHTPIESIGGSSSAVYGGRGGDVDILTSATQVAPELISTALPGTRLVGTINLDGGGGALEIGLGLAGFRRGGGTAAGQKQQLHELAARTPSAADHIDSRS